MTKIKTRPFWGGFFLCPNLFSRASPRENLAKILEESEDVMFVIYLWFDEWYGHFVSKQREAIAYQLKWTLFGIVPKAK